MLKIVTVVGARPQFIKAAAISRAIRARDDLSEVMVHTGQHFDAAMSNIFFSELDIEQPAHHLGFGGGSHGQMTGRMLEGLEDVLNHEKPDWVLVYGDTNSTIAGALAAAKLHIPIAHVEAGLRSFNKRMPEEINRILTDHVSTLLFCSTEIAVKNLSNEGIVDGVHHVGDVMYDATLNTIDRARDASDILQRLDLRRKEFILSTIHRAENTDDKKALSDVIDYLKAKAVQIPVILPLHPRTQAAVSKHGLDFDRLTVIKSIGYLDMVVLLDACTEVYTDSGGVQKEAYFHRKPCTTLRDETEWMETIEAGWNRLWKGADFVSPRTEIDEYGEGNSSGKILDLMSQGLPG